MSARAKMLEWQTRMHCPWCVPPRLTSYRDSAFMFDVSGNGSASGLSSYRDARMPHQPRTRRHIPLRGTEIDPRSRGLQLRSRTRATGHDFACTDADAKCPDWHDEGARIRGRLHVSAPVLVRTFALRRLCLSSGF